MNINNVLIRVLLVLIVLTGFINCLAMDDDTSTKWQDNIVLESSDGVRFPISKEFISKHSITVRNMLEDIALSDTPIPLPSIDGDTLKAVINCMEDAENIPPIMASLSGDPVRLHAFFTALIFLDARDFIEQIPAFGWCLSKMPKKIIKETLYEEVVDLKGGAPFIWKLNDKKNNEISSIDYREGIATYTISSVSKVVYCKLEANGAYLVVKFKAEQDFLYIFDAKTGAFLSKIGGHAKECRLSKISVDYPDAPSLAIVEEDEFVTVWDIHSGNCLAIFHNVHSFETDEKISFIMLDLGIKVEIIDVRNNKLLQVFEKSMLHHTYSNRDESSSGRTLVCNKNFLVSSDADDTVRVWDIATKKCLYILQNVKKKVVEIAHDGRSLIVASRKADSPGSMFSASIRVREWFEYPFSVPELHELTFQQLYLVERIYDLTGQSELNPLDLLSEALKEEFAQLKISEPVVIFESLPYKLGSLLLPYVRLPKTKEMALSSTMYPVTFKFSENIRANASDPVIGKVTLQNAQSSQVIRFSRTNICSIRVSIYFGDQLHGYQYISRQERNRINAFSYYVNGNEEPCIRVTFSDGSSKELKLLFKPRQ